MTFKKGHNQGAKPIGDQAMTGRIDIRTSKELEDRVKTIPNWREKLRVLLEEWVKNQENSAQP